MLRCSRALLQYNESCVEERAEDSLPCLDETLLFVGVVLRVVQV